MRGVAVGVALLAATGFSPRAAPERPDPPADLYAAVGWGAVAAGLVAMPVGLVAVAAWAARRSDEG